MKAFVNCIEYEDYLKKINEGLEKYSFLSNDSSREKEKKLEEIKDSERKDKIIGAFNVIDSALSSGHQKSDEMYKKLNSLLALGVLFSDFYPNIEGLSADDLAFLAYGGYSEFSDTSRAMISILSDKKLLKAVRKGERASFDSLIGSLDTFYRIQQYYMINPFVAALDEEARQAFVNSMIEKINNGSLTNGTTNYIDDAQAKLQGRGVSM